MMRSTRTRIVFWYLLFFEMKETMEKRVADVGRSFEITSLGSETAGIRMPRSVRELSKLSLNFCLRKHGITFHREKENENDYLF